jgi:molybdate/tungstate transport system substrate-binding protein
MTSVLAKNRTRFVALIFTVCTGLAGAAITSTPASAAAAAYAKPTGTVNVAYAASLEFLNEKVVSPAFKAADGYNFSGFAMPSGAIEADIAAGEIHPNVFESVGGDNITPLEPSFTKWYIQYAGTSMVIAYNPHSKYASQFKAYAAGKKPLAGLFRLLETPGLRLGRTDPNIDPQGRDFIYMLELAQAYYHLPSNTVTRILGTNYYGTPDSTQIYAESALDSILQSGQLDAASAFVTQAIELHLDYIKLPAAINLGSFADAALYQKASVEITGNVVKHGSPQVIDITIIGKPTAAGIAFVKYTLSAAGLAQYKRGGFTLLTPTVTGSRSAVPSAILSELGG